MQKIKNLDYSSTYGLPTNSFRLYGGGGAGEGGDKEYVRNKMRG